MVVCSICGYRGKVLTRHIKIKHDMSRKEYESRYPDSLVVSPETSRRGIEIASHMHTDEVKKRADLSRRAYIASLTDEEKKEKAAPMISYKRSEKGREEQRQRMREYRSLQENSDEFAEWREHRRIKFSKLVKKCWKDPVLSERMKSREGLVVSEETRAVRRNNMRLLNKRIYRDKNYREEVCSPLWGKGISNGKRGGIRNWYVSRSGVEYVFRSLWELNIAIYLDDLNLSWSYESLYFSDSGMNYLPDFYVSDYNLVVEVKPKDFIDEVEDSMISFIRESGYKFTVLTDLSLTESIPLRSLSFREEKVLYKEEVQRLSKAEELRSILESVE